MTDDDIYAFRPVPRAPPRPLAPRRAWPWVLGLLAVLALAAVAAAGAALMTLGDAALHGVHVIINGDEWDPAVVGSGHWSLAFAGACAALLAVVVVVPMALLVGLLSAALGIGIALLAVLAVAAVVLSPLWLVVLLLWMVWRRRPAAPATIQG